MSRRSFAERYRANLFESVIPFWTRHSADREHGGYFMCLDREGRVSDPQKSVWLQGRQIWMYSRLYNEVDRRQEWLDMATLGMDFLLANARGGEGRYYFRLERLDEYTFGHFVDDPRYGEWFGYCDRQGQVHTR